MPTVLPPSGLTSLARLRGGVACCLLLVLLAGCRSAPAGAPVAPAGAATHVLRAQPPTPSPEPLEPPGRASSVEADVRALADADFVARSLAAQRLVRAGAASLPALGAAGPQPVAGPGSRAESTTAPVIAAIVRALTTPEVVGQLASPHAGVREAAALEAGRRNAWDAVPALIEALADPVPDVRTTARAALKRVTGEMGDPRLAGATRADLRARWRVWWNQVGRARGPASNRGS